ncbi:hypothetical protein KIN20_030531 [Parelaphostrongylus tenuis]|uniref:Reverse transcriptase domain-containing protein n=1 Tax=Parelaphostrongylus tenuis TaxID=148309 RepID=A0AAD5R3W7_PARTN|nr:hypothetical protein KIN20_030531 [Parelaphostrongylus tenuis]
MEARREYHMNLILTFVDYDNAFDLIASKRMQSYERWSIKEWSPSYIGALLDCYRNCTKKMQIAHRLIRIGKPIRQGDTTLLELLNIALQWGNEVTCLRAEGHSCRWKIPVRSSLYGRYRHLFEKYHRSRHDVRGIKRCGKNIGLRLNRMKTRFMKNAR